MRSATLLALTVAAQTSGPAPRPHEIADLIRETGVRQAVIALEADGALWEAVVRGVASGRPEWLEVGRELRRHTKADASEWLDLALSEALLPAPEGVLRIADGTVWHVDDFCATIGFAERGASDGELIASYLDSRRDALLKVEASELIARRDRCLAGLAAAREDLLGAGYDESRRRPGTRGRAKTRRPRGVPGPVRTERGGQAALTAICRGLASSRCGTATVRTPSL